MEYCDLVSKGVTTCQGCPMELIVRSTLAVLGEKTIVLTPPSCAAIITGNGDETGFGIPALQTVLMSLPAYASGISEALKIKGKNDVHVVGFIGDGGAFDIGLASLSGAIERGHRAIYICYDNEAYMNTGNQRSGATMQGAWTKTTPTGKKETSKNIDFMLLHQELDYQATASIGNIRDFRRKVEKASNCSGPSFIHVHAPCNTGWRFDPSQTIRIARLGIQSGLWLLWEKENGKVKINSKNPDYSKVTQYLELQQRFAGLSEAQIQGIIETAKCRRQTLEKLEELPCL